VSTQEINGTCDTFNQFNLLFVVLNLALLTMLQQLIDDKANSSNYNNMEKIKS
jgi:hypothetical protein